MADDAAHDDEKLPLPLALMVNTVILIAIAGFFLFLAAWIIYAPLDSYPAHLRLSIAAVAWLVFIPVAWLLARTSAKRKVWFWTLVAVSAVGFPLFSMGSLGVVNALFDFEPPREQRALVLKKQRLRPRSNSHPYRLHVRSWRPESQSYELIVDKQLWKRTEPGAHVIVLEGPGLLGWPWAVEVRGDDGA